MLLSKRDIKATDTAAPFGGGTAPMSGGGGGAGAGGSGSPHEASPSHQGPPPAAAGASHMIRCNECGYMAKDGGDLDEHMRKEHFVSDTMASRQDDIAHPAALIFVDALGDTLPFKAEFTFKELSDFCHREGVNLLSPTPLVEADFIRIAESIAALTGNHVVIAAQPTKGAEREPLSAVDLSVASKSAQKECRHCQAKIASYREFCDDCRTGKDKGKPIRLYAHVTLKDGASLHVVEIGKEFLIGVDDFFVPRDFTAAEVATAHNMDDDLRTVEASRCDMCGEEVYEFSAKCANCGSARG